MESKSIWQEDETDSVPLQNRTYPPKRILVVDDDQSNRQQIMAMLIQSGFEATGASDGASGCAAFQTEHYDLLITDNSMPKVTGVEMVRTLHGLDPTLPVIMATGTIPAEELRRDPHLKISAFLLKPYTAKDMLRTVKRVMRDADRPPRAPTMLMHPKRQDGNIQKSGAPPGTAEQRQTNRAHRILVVEDDAIIRRLNTNVLRNSGFLVDAAEDGAVAWDSLQRNSYNLMVTDNDMPKVSGVELLAKIHAAEMGLLVIMATAAIPEEEFIRAPWLTPAATLLKPYPLEALVGMVRNLLRATVPVVALFWFLAQAAHAQKVQPASEKSFQSPPNVEQPTAMTLSVHGKCERSEDGVTFSNLDKGQILEQGAIVRTGENGWTDLFFRRTGTTVRLQAGTKIKIEKMTVTMKDGLPVVDTLLDLRTGRIFAVVRSTVAGSTLEIRNADGRAVVEGSGIGRYIITADGTHVAAKGSILPLKVVGENGITIITAGEQFDKKAGKMPAASSSLWVKDMVELDELQASSEAADAKDPSLKP
jgi:DNA-binding response OmpR family regulator